MKRVAILTAGGDTPALNATICGAVERANQLEIEVYGIIKGFGGMVDPRVPHVPLNPLFSTIPELDPLSGGNHFRSLADLHRSRTFRGTQSRHPQAQSTEN